ncbi:MAG: FtsX-like permease family protein [Pseudomonadota bacterium]
MKSLRFAARALWREARSGELAVLLLALAVAVGSVTAIGFLTDRIGQAVALQAAEVLAADLRLSSPGPVPEQFEQRARDRGLQTASLTTFPSVVYAGDDTALASVRAATAGYPLRGRVRIADRLLGAPREASGIPRAGTVWAETGLLAQLGIDVGGVLELGAIELTVDAVITYRPDQSPGFSGLAPALVLNDDDLARSELLGEGSRASYILLLAGDRGAISEYAAAVRPDLPDDMRLQDRGDAGRELNTAIQRASRFLSLASLVSLLLASVAVAMSARRYAERRLDTVALFKSLGATQGFVVRTSVIQLFVLAAVASVLGAAMGYAAEQALASVLAGWLRGDLPEPSLAPIALGAGTAMVLMLGFALPSALRLGRTPPLRVLRRDLDPVPLGAWVSYGLAMLALGALVYWAVRDVALLAVIGGGTVATGAVLYLAGVALVRLLSISRGRVGVAWRYGLANVARRGRSSAVQIVAFGLGLMVLLLLTVVRNDLLDGWRASLDETAPNHFLINILDEDRDGISALLTERGLAAPAFTPLVRARMTAINGAPVSELEFDDPRGEELARRGQNLSYRATLPASNALSEGAFWSPEHTGSPEVSVELDAARAMALSLGDELTFDVAGEPMRATVTSFRTVEWQSFDPNFFMIFTPNALAEYPKSFITSMRVADAERSALLDLVRAYPGVSVIDLEAIIDQVRAIIDKAALAVQLVFAFTLAAGVVVLFAAVQATLDERRYESALLRTFGASRRTVLTGLITEFAVLGLAAGLLAALGATGIGLIAAERLFNLSYDVSPMLWAAGLLIGVVVVGVSGTLASRAALSAPPVATLRQR